MELTRLSRCPGPARGQGCPPLGSLSWKQQDKPSDHRPLPGGPQRAAEQDARLPFRVHTHTHALCFVTVTLSGQRKACPSVPTHTDMRSAL